jgi:hypothetical protein
MAFNSLHKSKVAPVDAGAKTSRSRSGSADTADLSDHSTESFDGDNSYDRGAREVSKAKQDNIRGWVLLVTISM